MSSVSEHRRLWEVLDQKQVLSVLLAILCITLTTLYLIYKRFVISTVPCPCAGRVDGKTAIVTGANSGIGKETAKELAKRGARVILACRNMKEANEAVLEIREETGSDEVFTKKLDLSSMESIRDFVKQIKEKNVPVDILVNNAGVSMDEYQKTEDNFEYTFAVNYLGPFLLSNLLVEVMLDSEQARIVNVAAHTHVFGHMDFSDLMQEKAFSPFKAYCQSKLALISFTRELAQRLDDTQIKTYAVHPGMTYTKLRHRGHLFKKLILPYLCRSPKDGAQTSIYCAVAHELAEDSGWYYSNCDMATPIYEAYDEDVGRRLWEVSSKLVGLDKDEDEEGESI